MDTFSILVERGEGLTTSEVAVCISTLNVNRLGDHDLKVFFIVVIFSCIFSFAASSVLEENHVSNVLKGLVVH